MFERLFFSKIIITRTFSTFVEVVNSIGISNNDFTLSNASDQLRGLIYMKTSQKGEEERNRNTITYDNHHRREDFLPHGSVWYWDLRQSSMQWPIVHYVRTALIQWFHLLGLAVWSNFDRIDDHVQSVVWICVRFRHRSPMIEDGIDHVLEIPVNISDTNDIVSFFFRKTGNVRDLHSIFHYL